MRSVIAAGISMCRVGGKTSNNTARPMPATFAHRKPMAATCRVDSRCSKMKAWSTHSTSSTRSGLGMTKAGKPENQIARYHSTSTEQIGVSTRSATSPRRGSSREPDPADVLDGMATSAGIRPLPPLTDEWCMSRPRTWAVMATNRGSCGTSSRAGAANRHRHDLEHTPGRRREDQQPVGQHHRLIDVMGDEQHRLGPQRQLAIEPLADLLALHLVERGERLIHQSRRARRTAHPSRGPTGRAPWPKRY